MPIFEYHCRACEARFEKILASSNGEVFCDQCASPRVEQLLSVFSVAGRTSGRVVQEPGPCACGAPRRGMCGE